MFYFFIRYIFSEFKMNKSNRKNGFSQILILIIISFLAIALPITTKLVQKSQENRSSAATKTVYDCLKGSSQGVRTVGTYSSSGACSSACSGGACKSRTVTVEDAKPPTCSYTYSTWGACVNGVQNRNITSRSPDGCSGGSPVLNQNCTPEATDNTKIAGRCGSGINKCETGTLVDLADETAYYKWKCGITVCTYTKQKINGYCGSANNSCTGGTLRDDADTSANYVWTCLGVNGGNNASCSKAKTVVDGCGTGLYTCNSGAATNKEEDKAALTWRWKCGTVSCSLPYASCSAGNRPLGCPCPNNNSLCASGTCYDNYCVGSGCKYAGSFISAGQSQCFNAFFGAYSDLVRCDIVNGKPRAFIVKSYKKANCEGIESDGSGLGCTYGKTTLVDGQHQCFNVFMKSGVFSGSVMIACDNGVPRTETRFPRKNCAEGNDNADDDVDTPTADDDETGNTTTTKFYYGKNCTEGSFTSYSDCTSKTGYNCFNSKDVCLAYYGIKYDLYSKSGATCDSSTGNWKCTHITNSSKPGDGVTTFTDESACEGASGCDKSSSDDGGGGGDYSVCTANAVSTTECYDSTHLKKCDSTGLAWIQGDQCSTGQVCTNGVCGVGTTGDLKLSFKIAFDGVASGNLTCMDNFKTVNLIVGAVGTTLTQELSVGVSKTALTTSKTYAIFEADNVALGVGFSGRTNVYARIKGQVHARMYYCVKSQSAKNTSEVCNLSLDGTVNNFYEYPIFGGDVNQDGVVNTSDYTVIKTALFTTGCGIKSDLNGDAIVNEFDYKIFKVALEAKYDE